MPADGTMPRRTVMPGTLPAAQNPEQGKMALRADDGPAAVTVRPAPGLTAAPLVHAVVQGEKEPARRGTTNTDVTAAAASVPQSGSNGQKVSVASGSPAAVVNRSAPVQESAPVTARPAPGLAAVPLVHAAAAQATADPARETSESRKAPALAVMPAPQNRGQKADSASSSPAAAVKRSAPTAGKEPSPVSVHPAPA